MFDYIREFLIRFPIALIATSRIRWSFWLRENQQIADAFFMCTAHIFKRTEEREICCNQLRFELKLKSDEDLYV